MCYGRHNYVTNKIIYCALLATYISATLVFQIGDWWWYILGLTRGEWPGGQSSLQDDWTPWHLWLPCIKVTGIHHYITRNQNQDQDKISERLRKMNDILVYFARSSLSNSGHFTDGLGKIWFSIHLMRNYLSFQPH